MSKALPLLPDAELDRIRSEYPLREACPTCHGKKEYLLEGVTTSCNCFEQIRLHKAYFSANIGYRFQVQAWDDFKSSDREHLVPDLLEYVEKFESHARYGIGWTLAGPLGTGKTLLLCCTLKDLIKQGHSCYFIQGSDLKSTWVSSWSDSKAKATLDKKLRNVDVLGIDDLTTGLSEAHIALISDSLETVIRYRYNNCLPTLITTNLDIEDEAKDFPRVFSLLSALNTWYKTEGKDYRGGAYRQRLQELEMNGETLPIV